MATQKKDTPDNFLLLVYRFLSSYKLATVVLILMTLVTLFGTLGQVNHGLHAAKEKYFYSFLFTDKIGSIPIVLPGGLPLMFILFFNMVLGAIVKVRKRLKGLGLLISHIGMLLLLAGGFVTYAFATDGYMAMYPGMKTNRVESYRKWQLEIIKLTEENKAEKLFVYPSEALQSIKSNEQRSIPGNGLPFDIVINGYSSNAMPVPVSAPIAAGVQAKQIDGFKLAPQDKSKEAEQNLPGCYLEIQPTGDEKPIETILWAGSYKFDPGEKPMPFIFEVEGQKYGALLAKKSWTVPFEVQLDEFIFEQHPGMSMARNYESRVTRFEEGKSDTSLEIKMNEPMRYEGYTFFQESFGPAGSQPGDRMYSQFAVANNPADQWPLIALCITGAGLLVHFFMMLVGFVVKSFQSKSKPKTA
ncbi:MAG: hypothetical protein CMO55_13330 [Verrucomicrobiales bacterium]|nr:hypothetical protein [Verrucomicrobiales bacterium]